MKKLSLFLFILLSSVVSADSLRGSCEHDSPYVQHTFTTKVLTPTAVKINGIPVDPSTLNGIAMTLPSGENQTLFSLVQIVAREVVRDGATIDSLQIYSEDCGCNFIKFGR